MINFGEQFSLHHTQSLQDKVKELEQICDAERAKIERLKIVGSDLSTALTESKLREERLRDWKYIKQEYPKYYHSVLVETENGSNAVCWLASDEENYIWTISGTDIILSNVVKWIDINLLSSNQADKG